MVFELCNEYAMASYVYDVIIHRMLSNDDIAVKLHHIGRYGSEISVIVTFNCVAKDWPR